jgi:hypothetical protein
VSRLLVKLSVSLAILWPAADAFAAPPAPASSPGAMTITFAEPAARLVRDTGIYRAGRGVVLRTDDMLESGGGAIQLDAGGATIALGPASRVYIRNGGELVLLDGWLKLQARADRALTLATAVLQLAGAGTTVTLHVAGDTTELFAEAGEVPVRELDAGKPRRAGKVAPEQFASRSGALALRIAPRPPAAFLATMPRDLRDQLVPLDAHGPAVPPRLERPASFAELAPWLTGQPLLRQRLQLRFDPPRIPPHTARSAPRSSMTGNEASQ